MGCGASTAATALPQDNGGSGSMSARGDASAAASRNQSGANAGAASSARPQQQSRMRRASAAKPAPTVLMLEPSQTGGRPDTPVGVLRDELRYFCPVCLHYFPNILTCAGCCGNYVCVGCALMHLQRKGALSPNAVAAAQASVAIGAASAGDDPAASAAASNNNNAFVTPRQRSIETQRYQALLSLLPSQAQAGVNCPACTSDSVTFAPVLNKAAPPRSYKESPATKELLKNAQRRRATAVTPLALQDALDEAAAEEDARAETGAGEEEEDEDVGVSDSFPVPGVGAGAGAATAGADVRVLSLEAPTPSKPAAAAVLSSSGSFADVEPVPLPPLPPAPAVTRAALDTVELVAHVSADFDTGAGAGAGAGMRGTPTQCVRVVGAGYGQTPGGRCEETVRVRRTSLLSHTRTASISLDDEAAAGAD